jgi:excisionase family DNA binding protein
LAGVEDTGMNLAYYTVEQVSEQTGMSKDWLWQQCRDRKIPHHRLGRTYRFTADDLANLQAATAVAPKAVQA